MFMLNYVKRDDANGYVAQAYGFFPERMDIPAPLQLLSASPKLLKAQVGVISHFTSQDEVDFSILTAIRYTAARMHDYQACTDLNASLLNAQGMTDDEIEVMYNAPQQAPFNDREKALYTFVVRALENPMSTTQSEIDELKTMGWSEAAILDSVSHGAYMQAHGTVFKTFMIKE